MCRCRLGWILIFLVMFLTEKKKKTHRWISDPQIIYNEALCDNIILGSHFALTRQFQLRWWRNGKAASVCYYLQFPWENWKRGRGENPEGSSNSHIGTLFLFSVQGKIIYCFLCCETVLLWYIHLYSVVSTKCYLNRKSYFRNTRINCKDLQSL